MTIEPDDEAAAELEALQKRRMPKQKLHPLATFAADADVVLLFSESNTRGSFARSARKTKTPSKRPCRACRWRSSARSPKIDICCKSPASSGQSSKTNEGDREEIVTPLVVEADIKTLESGLAETAGVVKEV